MLNTMTVPTILHVEDDENDRLLLAIAHQRANVPAHLIGVGDGEQAIAYLQGDGVYSDRNRAPLPNLVLLDLKLPLKSGFDVLAWIRGRDILKDLPVIILSSSPHEIDKERALGGGANFYIVKPVSITAMVEIVKELYGSWLQATSPCACA
jgi:DNA-binding response OmpR family regulator